MALEELGHVLWFADVDVAVVHPFPEGEEGCFVAGARVVGFYVDHAALWLHFVN